MKRIILIFFVLLCYSQFSQAQSPLIQRARIHCTASELRQLASLGIAIDEGTYSKDGYFTSDFFESELNSIRQHGYIVDILIADLGRFYAERNVQGLKVVNTPAYKKKIAQSSSSWQVPNGFHLGSMGGFDTWTEVQAELDNMVALYPNLITVKAPATTTNTAGGRPIFWVKISDNPNTSENEPQILYTGLHHAREPISIQLLIYYMYYLLENYNTDPLIHFLVDNTEMFFIPVLNPDGYCYNEFTNPLGGGNWRKNRKDNGGGAYGIDLNRNYGYMWGIDDIGSSVDPNSETYRGTAGFSEAETQNIRDFVIAHNFKLVMNYHAYRNGILFPWGYTGTELAPDDSTFRIFCRALTHENQYTFGNVSAVLNYLSNGGSDDWYYGEQTVKPKIFSFTPEVGLNNDGFWPAPERIIPLCQDNMWQNLVAALLVNKYAVATEDNPVFIGPQGYLKYKIRRLGMESSAFTVTIQATDNSFQSIGSPVTYNNLSYLQLKEDSIPYTLNTAVLPGQEIKFLLKVSYSGISFTDTITKYYGTPVVIYNNNCNTLAGWSGTWALTSTEYYSPPSCITDSPGGLYNNNTNSSITLTSSIDLSNAALAFLNFRAKWDLEPGFDYVQVKASTNNGLTWVPLQGLYTHAGGINEPVGEPLYDGQHDWVAEMINLHDFTGASVKIQFTIVTDAGVTADGYYFDDIEIQIVSPLGISNVMGYTPVMSDPVPNPARQSVSFIFLRPGDESTQLVIHNQLGQLIHMEKVEGTQTVINTESWSPGLYFYSLMKQSAILSKGKFIVTP